MATSSKTRGQRRNLGPRLRGPGRRPLRTFAAQSIFWSVLVVTVAGTALPAAAAPPVVTATVVQTILTSAWVPASPDPSGIVWLPAKQRFEVTDSEVDETTGAGYHNVNLWQVTPGGAVQDTGTTYTPAPNFSKEPTGLGYDPATNTLFVSDDDKKRIWIDKPGTDGRFGTADDAVTSIDLSLYGVSDAEDPEFDTTTGNPTSGHLFFLSGAQTEVYDLNPVNGVFGDGNDVATHFDVGSLASDFEALGSDPVANTLFVGTNTSAKKIFEVTKTGTLVRTIDASGISGLKHISGLAYAPSSFNPAVKDFWIVDRQVDNGSNSSENDGKLFEITVPISDTPPTVNITSPGQETTVSGTVTIQASPSDDHGVTQVQFKDGSTVIGTDANASDGWSTSWDTTLVADGAHTITAIATDTIGQTGSGSNSVTVDNVDSPPTVNVTSPAEGGAVTGTVSITADASDDRGLAQVEFFVDGTSIGVDSNGTDGWSRPWDTSSASEGSHTIAATAKDNSGQTASDSNGVIVDRTAPSVAITAPPAGTVAGTIGVVAGPSDTGGSGIAKVQFFLDGTTSIGSDTNGQDGWSVQWNTASVLNGPHGLTAQATDRAGNAATSAPVQVAVDNPLVLDLRVATGADDAEQKSNGSTTLTSTDLDMMTDGTNVQQAVGLRFTGVQVPQGAQVTRAYVQFTADETHPDVTTLTINGERSPNAAAFATVKFNITSRQKTTSSVAWSVPQWTQGQRGSAQQTSDISPVLTEIFSPANGWAPGNALVLIITGSGKQVAKSLETGAANAPVLHIEYAYPA